MRRFSVAVAVCVAISSSAHAAIVFDRSPDATGDTGTFDASNYATGQNFLVGLTLSETTTINGFDFYSAEGVEAVGRSAVVKIWNSVAGAPAATNLFTYSTTISAIDNVGSSAAAALRRIHVDFTPTTLAAGTYWIGAMGADGSAGFALWRLSYGKPGVLWQLSQDNLQFDLSPYASATYRVHSVDTVTSVPEPATWALMIGGCGMAGVTLRRRRAQPA